MKTRRLVLADGTVFQGEGFGSLKACQGELVFTTGMTGYQEAITDLSFAGQMITFTYPLIGNTGINRDDYESIQPACTAIVVRELARRASNWRAHESLETFLEKKDIVGISGIDTRALTRKLREFGTIRAAIVDMDTDIESIVDELNKAQVPVNYVEHVSTKSAYPCPGTGHRVVIIDYGLKHSILRELTKRNCACVVLPHTATLEMVLEHHPDGILLSNGPGDPKENPQAVDTIRSLLGHVPIFGICLGHQLLALASGANTYKLPYGHRGLNHPVREIVSNKLFFTSQNHGYAVDPKSCQNTEIRITHIEINDETVEGIRHREHPAFSVQFHPDATPGPHDALSLFDDFIEMMDMQKEKKDA